MAINYDLFRTFAQMLMLNLLLSALSLTTIAEEDSIRTERLDEVVVTSNSARQRIKNVQTGAEVIQIENLTSAPQLFGENDIMRSIQLLPGVKSESDASSGFQVRGGTSAQNQVLFDNAPVYNVGHLAGLFSAFNDDALTSATLYKGLLPAQYGGASSAVLDVTGRSGSKTGWHGGATIGLLRRPHHQRQDVVSGHSQTYLYGYVPETIEGLQEQHPVFLRYQRQAGLDD